MTDDHREQNHHQADVSAESHPQQPAPQTAEPQRQGEAADVATEPRLPGVQQAPEVAQNRGEDALDVALQGSMITSDPPSTLMADEDA